MPVYVRFLVSGLDACDTYATRSRCRKITENFRPEVLNINNTVGFLGKFKQKKLSVVRVSMHELK